nr:TATA box-binding protein-associated factor RNA polymerase I subunit B isoform X1 [Leptinotarsa decemlineata]
MRHLTKHKADHSRNLTCHKFTYKDCSREYKNGIHFLSPVKLYCILYLGLLITKDKIQLGDLFRFIREGHLSFNNFTQLFPEGYTDKFLNIRNNLKNSLFTNKYFRVTTAKLATFLKVTTYIRVPDLVELTKRYCKEMNLPDDFFLAVTNILSKTNVKLKMTRVGKIIPNYEGRVMSLILFTFKLLFGIDGKSEDHLSKYAQLINELNLCEQSMFDIKKWMMYIEYRNLVLSEYHFPTHDISNSKVDSNLLLQYMKSHNIEYDENAKLTREMKDYKEILTRIKTLQNEFTTHLEYPASLTPFRNHIEVVLKWVNRPMSKEVLEYNFEKESLDFLLKPNEYLLTLNSSMIIKHRGANNNWIVEDIRTKRTVRNITCKSRNFVPVKIVSSVADEDMTCPVDEADTTPVKKVNPQYVQQQYQKCRRHVFLNNARYTRKFCKSVNIHLAEMDKNVSYSVHFNPYERYWFYLQMNIDLINKIEFNEFFNKNTDNFKIVFKECARIIEQNFQELYTELQFTELYLVFSANFGNQNNVPKPKRWLTEKLGFYVDQAETLW